MENVNTIICGNNLHIMSKFSNKVDLVYLDPPYNIANRSDFSSIEHISEDNAISFMKSRMQIIRELLKESGSVFYHCDWRDAAYVQLMLDEVFGKSNLLAKIIWKRNGNIRTSQRIINQTYDVILYYGKSKLTKYFPIYLPFTKSEIEEKYKYIDSESGKRYRLVNLTRPNIDTSTLTYEFMGVKRTWRFTKEKMEEEFKNGRIIQSRPGSVPMQIQYLGEGELISDIWIDKELTEESSKDKTGYPTQKPRFLLKRIIEMSTEIGDLVLDPFCGSGSTLIAAEELGRKWIGIDSSPSACKIAVERMTSYNQKYIENDILQFHDKRTFFELCNLPAFEFENWVISSLKTLLKDNSNFLLSKNLLMWGNKEVYSITTGAPEDLGADFILNSIPVMVKQKENIEGKEIKNFVTQIKYHNQTSGIYIGLGFSNNAITEAKLVNTLGITIVLISARDLIQE